MNRRIKETPTVEIPTPKQDEPRWARVIVLAGIGLATGLLAPQLTGLELGPNPPDSKSRKAKKHKAKPAAKPKAAAPLLTASAGATATPRRQSVKVGKGEVTACRNKRGRKQSDCGTIDADAIFAPALKKLTECSSAMGLEGDARFSWELNFKKERITQLREKNADLPSTTIRGLRSCVDKNLGKPTLSAIEHKHARYTLAFTVSFSSGNKKPSSTKPAGGAPEKVIEKIKIRWRTGLVRDEPKDGRVIIRLHRGKTVSIYEQKGKWYRISWGGKRQGWIYHKALGK